MRKSNYDKYPSTSVNGSLWEGWDAILNQIKMDLSLQNGRHVLVVECYQGVHHKELFEQLALCRWTNGWIRAIFSGLKRR
jgi:hypothetical protein